MKNNTELTNSNIISYLKKLRKSIAYTQNLNLIFEKLLNLNFEYSDYEDSVISLKNQYNNNIRLYNSQNLNVKEHNLVRNQIIERLLGLIKELINENKVNKNEIILGSQIPKKDESNVINKENYLSKPINILDFEFSLVIDNDYFKVFQLLNNKNLKEANYLKIHTGFLFTSIYHNNNKIANKFNIFSFKDIIKCSKFKIDNHEIFLEVLLIFNIWTGHIKNIDLIINNSKIFSK